MKRYIALPVAALLLVVLISGCTSPGITGDVLVGQDELAIPLSDISTTARWYEYNSGGTTVRFFAVKASDGSVKTAFDACDVCYSSHKGYRQEGSYMVCNNCGNKYPIDGLGTENKRGGGCWPGYLPNTIRGDNIIIKKPDLDSNSWRFR